MTVRPLIATNQPGQESGKQAEGKVAPAAQGDVRVGSKVFTESVVLAEMAVQLARDGGAEAVHEAQLGGTRILWSALLARRIDAYPEYTGTIVQEVLGGTGSAATEDDLRTALRVHGVGMTRPLGFNNTYAIGMREEVAARLGIARISDLSAHPDLRLAFSHEFLDRADGWPAVRQRYDLPHANVTGIDHALAYRALAEGTADATDLYSTDAEIAYYRLRVLADDRRLFPDYRAVFLYRLDLEDRSPAAVAALRRLEGRITEPAMIAMNERAKLRKVPEPRVAADFIRETFGFASDSREASLLRQFVVRTREHLVLVLISLSAAVLAAVPLGVVAAKVPVLGRVVLAAVAAIYTVPALALLVFMIPFLGIGTTPAVYALFLYSLLPIVRNTEAGLRAIPPSVRESAEVLGLPPAARLWRVELPMASPSILAGIKTAAVINVGTATLGALIGAGGYGQPILTGIRLDDTRLILLGAVPAAVLALLVQAAFGLAERVLVPRGLRLRPAE